MAGRSLEQGGRPILIIEDDAALREFLKLLLEADGFVVRAIGNGNAALDLAQSGDIEPSLIIADFNLPSGPSGLEVIGNLRAILQRHVPAIVLTGDISTSTIKATVEQEAVHLAKPVKADVLLGVVHHLGSLDGATPKP